MSGADFRRRRSALDSAPGGFIDARRPRVQQNRHDRQSRV